MEAELAYYQRRLAEESAAAELAQHIRVRDAHLELARLYAGRVDDLERKRRGGALQLVGGPAEVAQLHSA